MTHAVQRESASSSDWAAARCGCGQWFCFRCDSQPPSGRCPPCARATPVGDEVRAASPLSSDGSDDGSDLDSFISGCFDAPLASAELASLSTDTFAWVAVDDEGTETVLDLTSDAHDLADADAAWARETAPQRAAVEKYAAVCGVQRGWWVQRVQRATEKQVAGLERGRALCVDRRLVVEDVDVWFSGGDVLDARPRVADRSLYYIYVD